MIPAHGASITISPAEVYISNAPLSAALHGPGTRIPLARITGTTVLATPTDINCGHVLLDGADTTVTFAPNQQQHQQHFLEALASAQNGQAPAVIPGFDFVAIDVETANEDWGSICQVGLARVIDGRVTETQSWLCQPPADIAAFDQLNISIHGITASDVQTSPPIHELVPNIAEFIGQLPVIAHNAQFDMTAVHRACTASGIAAPPLHFACTLTLARNSNIHFPSHRLPAVAETLGVPQTKHHDAEDDALTCAGIAIELAKRAGHIGDLATYIQQQGFTIGHLHPDRVYPMLRQLHAGGGGRDGGGQGDAGAGGAGGVSRGGGGAGGTSRSGGERRGPSPWARTATPDVIPEANTEADPNGVLYGQNVTLSGEFDPYDKGMLWERMAELGATLGKNVTKKTTVLVCGAWATKTSKQKRAEELIDKGQEIQLWTAEQLYTALGLDEQPPF